MRVAFYSPIKPPSHPVPSGDRLMARLLIRALELGGARVDVASEFRSFRKAPPTDGMNALKAEASREIDRIAADWRRSGPPDLWFTYHPYYKAPDLIGPELARAFALPYVTAEASYSRRRDAGSWRDMQAPVGAAVASAVVNIAMTERDREGLRAAFPAARTAMLPPFIDGEPFLVREPAPEAGHLVAVAMMRPGDKLDSFRILAQSLAMAENSDWTLSIAGDGPARADVEALFAGFGPERIRWHGQMEQEAIAELLSRSCLFVWPGCGEAYGLAYLEAQAAGVPVVAQDVAGVPAVVIDGRTGILTPAGDIGAYAKAIDGLLSDAKGRRRLASGARAFVRGERSLLTGSRRLMSIIEEFSGVAA